MGELTIAQALEQTKERFVSIAPAQLKFESELGYTVQLLANTPFLDRAAKDDPRSLQQALTHVAAIDRSLNPAKKGAYLITRNMSVGEKQRQTRELLEPSYAYPRQLEQNPGVSDAEVVTYNELSEGKALPEWVVARAIQNDAGGAPDRDWLHTPPRG